MHTIKDINSHTRVTDTQACIYRSVPKRNPSLNSRLILTRSLLGRDRGKEEDKEAWGGGRESDNGVNGAGDKDDDEDNDGDDEEDDSEDGTNGEGGAILNVVSMTPFCFSSLSAPPVILR